MTKKFLTDVDITGNSLFNADNIYSYDTPSQRGMIEYNFPPQLATITNALTSGSIYGASFVAQTSKTVAHISVAAISTASTPVAGQNLMGLYSISGTTATQIAITGDLGNWSGGGWNLYSFVSSATLTRGGTYIVLFMSNASAGVHLAGLSSANNYPSLYNANLSNTAAPWYKFFVQTATGATALPASFTISSSTMTNTNALTPWVGLLT